VTYLLDTNVLPKPRRRQPAAGVADWIAARPRALAPGCTGRIRGQGSPGHPRIAAAWGRQQYAQPLPAIDALIAATARVHGMTMVTRNAKDFELAGVQVLNPFAD
jgi:predicted nucleic acid-binding protein